MLDGMVLRLIDHQILIVKRQTSYSESGRSFLSVSVQSCPWGPVGFSQATLGIFRVNLHDVYRQGGSSALARPHLQRGNIDLPGSR